MTVGALERVRALTVSGRTLVVGGVRTGAASRIVFYDHVAQKVEKTVDVPAHVLALASVTVSDEDGFVAACADGVLRWYSRTGDLVREVDAHRGAATGVATFGPIVASCGVDGAVRTFSRKTGAKKKEYPLSSQPLRAIAIDPAGEAMAAGGDDGIVRVITADRPVREMAGHEGAVTCLAFTPADGRLASGGEDGTARLWYLVGQVEADVRGRDESGHAGGVTAIVFPPAPVSAPDEAGARFFTAGVDGKIRLWRTSERRKPRTFETKGGEAIHAMVFAPMQGARTVGRLMASGDARTVFLFPFDELAQPLDTRIDLGHGFDALAKDLTAPARDKREATVRELASLDEPEALVLLVRALSTDSDADVRKVAAEVLAAHGRRDGRPALRERLDDESPQVRAAALAALRSLESDTPLAPLRAALASKFADMRCAALRALPPLAASSPLAAGLIAARLSDSDAAVRRVALAELVSLFPAGAIEPLRTAFERGAADVRAEVLVRGALAKRVLESGFAPIVGRALDDDDAEVRRVAFVVKTLTRPCLATWLETQDEAYGRALSDLVRRAAESRGQVTVAPEIDPDAAVVKSLSKFYAVFTHPKLGDVSIFRPELHTPIQPGDSVHVVGLKIVENQQRATDYVVGPIEPAFGADLEALRLELAPRTPLAEPDETDLEPLIAALACRMPDTALRGARGLALLGDMRALGALLTISREPEPTLRRASAFALAALRDSRAERRLAWMMSDADAAVRDAALRAFSSLSPDPLEIASVALQSAHEDVRVRGLDLLVKQGKGNPRAETLLGDALEDEAPKVRAEAFRTLWAWHEAEPLGPIDRALAARFPDLRLRAVQELIPFAKAHEGPLVAGARERLQTTIGDRDAAVGRAAYDAMLELRGKGDATTPLAAMASARVELRAQGAKDSSEGKLDEVRSALTKLIEDSEPQVRIAAVDALDRLVTEDRGPLYVALQSSHLDARVRAAEVLSARRDEQIVMPMQSLVADKELLGRQPEIAIPLRQRAAVALASLGLPKLLRYFAIDLIKDEDPAVREQGARGLSNASRRGEEGFLLDLLGHTEIAVRSWAAEGLARLGDARALPVLTGTLRHEHPPIRVGAILSFAALGPEGYGGMLQGLEDPSREVQRIVLSVILARDMRAFRAHESPELLSSALSSQRPEVRFAAARAIELRVQPDEYLAHLVQVLAPDPPDRAEDMAKWPDESTRARMMIGLAEALAGDRPEQRYAAAQTLRLRDRPLEFFREVQRTIHLRAATAPWVPETTPLVPTSHEQKKGPLGLLRRLFASGPEARERTTEPPPPPIANEEQRRLRHLALGAYVGLLRQAGSDDEAHRVRRDAIERIAELTRAGHVTSSSATPALARALDDPNHMVRRTAFAALRTIYGESRETPLALALASASSDVIRSALDELDTLAADGDERSRARIVKALDSGVPDARKYAFELLERRAPGSLEPLLAALGSAHADIRIGVLERLATSQDTRVLSALGRALESDHEDLRLRAAELLASRQNEKAVDVLASALRSDEAAIVSRACEALARIASPSAARAIGVRLDEVEAESGATAGVTTKSIELLAALGRMRGEAALDVLAARFSLDDTSVRGAAVAASMALLGPRSDTELVPGMPKPKAPEQSLGARFADAASKSRYPDVRLAAARRLDDISGTPALDVSAEGLLVALFGDRNVEVRAQAVASYANRVEKKGADPAPLESVIRGGARETMLSAAVGLASKRLSVSFRPLLLFVRAGDGAERPRALLGLGSLGDKRALSELETVASGGTEEAPADEAMQAAALEALGRLFAALDDSEVAERVRDRVESSIGARQIAMAVAAVRGLRWIGDERSRSRIEGVLGSGLHDVERRAAAESLRDLSSPASERALAKALDDHDADVRDLARAALMAIFPSERTRVELLAVESKYPDVAEPAASFLSEEGDPGELIGKLAKIENASLRARLRFGLSRRASLPAPALETLLTSASPEARADAAWLVGVSSDRLAKAGHTSLLKALASAANRADEGRRAAALGGLVPTRDAETHAEHHALWAARRLAAPLVSLARKLVVDLEVPPGLRAEAVRGLSGSAEDVAIARRGLGDADLTVRADAASMLATTGISLSDLRTTPLDPNVLGRVVAARGLSQTAAAAPGGAAERRIVAPFALGRRNLGGLIAIARRGEGSDRLDAILDLGLSDSAEAIDALEEIAAKANKAPAEVKKVAYRALRRAKRRREKAGRHEEVRS